MGVTLICESCGQAFIVRPSRVGKRRHCSPACRDTRIAVICENCGVIVQRPRWHRVAGYKHSFCSIRCQGLWRRRVREGYHAVNVQLFDVWSDNFAYMLGLMFADGNVRDNGAVSFVSADKELTRFVQSLLAPTAPMRIETTKRGTTVWRWSIWSTNLVNLFAAYGLYPRKSRTMAWVNIPDAVIYHFIRGYLDGDGWIDKAGRFAFATASRAFADGLCTTLNSLGHKTRVYTKRTCLAVTVSVPGSRTLGPRLYADGFCLTRKRLAFLERVKL